MSEMMRETMNDKVYLVTGAAGFLGGTICRELLESGAYVVEARAEETESRHFAYQLYQYDVSAGKAILAGDEDEMLHPLYGMGLEARNMGLEQA
ncbi:MAG: NAD-dependent epimerase/dehydratase family protein, partial [Peptococcaceae bacterium]|nr:NAD-dependent epimerase/dehydratase family protein [Peptococcaceae bacterium]